jgi:hypothetical protein
LSVNQGQITPLADKVNQGKWNRKIGDRNQRIRDNMQANQCRLPQITMTMTDVSEHAHIKSITLMRINRRVPEEKHFSWLPNKKVLMPTLYFAGATSKLFRQHPTFWSLISQSMNDEVVAEIFLDCSAHDLLTS